ncbi:MAG: HD-GYP domain-containing protein [Defluviitaleaceae bacterium]|nr:HD-GYP domain-containing protein [Defluviitaleaceae bacterium]
MKRHINVIHISALQEGMKIAETINVVSGGKSLLIAREGLEVDSKVIKVLTRHEVKTLKVYSYEEPPEDYFAPEPAPKKSRPKLEAQPATQPLAKTAVSLPTVKTVLTEREHKELVERLNYMFESLQKPGEVVKMTTAYKVLSGFERALGQVVAAVTADPSGLIHIHDLKSYDEYTYHHSMSVALLSVATGQAMGLDTKELLKLCRCAVLHDIGKQAIPLKIINKPGKLTTDEFFEMKGHALSGALRIKAKAVGDMDMWKAIMFHHEKFDGSGYPKGLKGEEIPLYSRIIAVADVYDALTSFRPYRDPMPPGEAYELICSEVGRSFDFNVVSAFSARLELYPNGSVLELSDKRRGVVVDNKNVQRPTIQLLDTGKPLNLANMENLSVVITKVVNPKAI